MGLNKSGRTRYLQRHAAMTTATTTTAVTTTAVTTAAVATTAVATTTSSAFASSSASTATQTNAYTLGTAALPVYCVDYNAPPALLRLGIFKFAQHSFISLAQQA